MWRHPRGAQVGPALESAIQAASTSFSEKINQPSRLLEFLAGSKRWEPQSTSGWKAGYTLKDADDSSREGLVTAAATYAYSGPFSFEVVLGLSDLRAPGPHFAYEHIWVGETIAALVLSGLFYRAIPGVTFVHVDLELIGLKGRTDSTPAERRLASDRREIEDEKYRETSSFPITDLTERPDAVAAQLLDRLLTSFDAKDVVRELLKS